MSDDEKFCMVYGTRRGITFEWKELSFLMPMPKAMELLDMLEVIERDGDPAEDDFKTDLWVGNDMIRYGANRCPIHRPSIMPFLMSAMEQHNKMVDDMTAQQGVEEVMKDIVKGLFG